MNNTILNSTVNWLTLVDFNGLERWVVDKVGEIIVLVIAGYFIYRLIDKQNVTEQIQREDKREIRQVEREDKQEARQIERENEQTQKQIEATQEAVRIDFHIENLRKYIDIWMNLLPEIPLTETTKITGRYDGFNISFIEKIKALELFQDYFYHDPDIKESWEYFESLSNNYSLKIEELFNLIKKDTNQKLENLKIEDSFYGSVFRGVIIEAKNKNDRYDYFWSKMSRNGIDLIHLGYCEVWEKCETLDHADNNKFNTGACYWIAETNDPDSIETIHKKLIKDGKEQHIKLSTELFEMETALRNSKDELYNYLKTTRQKPFLKLDCEFIKVRR